MFSRKSDIWSYQLVHVSVLKKFRNLTWSKHRVINRVGKIVCITHYNDVTVIFLLLRHVHLVGELDIIGQKVLGHSSVLKGTPQPGFPIEIHQAKYKQDNARDGEHAHQHGDNCVIDLISVRVEPVVIFPEIYKKEDNLDLLN